MFRIKKLRLEVFLDRKRRKTGMIYKKTKIIGKNGKEYMLRSPKMADAEKMIEYLKMTAEETEYGLSYADEMNFTIKEEEEFISKYAENKGSLMISVFDGDELVGNAYLTCVMDRRKTKHRATFGIALFKCAWGQGIGYKVLSELIDFSKRAGYEQLELEVVSSNIPAISLYKKLGFQVYGERLHSFRLKNGTYSSEMLIMLPLKKND